MSVVTTPTKIYTIQDKPRPDDMADYLARVRAVSGRLAKLLGAERAMHAMERSRRHTSASTARRSGFCKFRRCQKTDNFTTFLCQHGGE